ncbi:fragment of transposase (part 1) [Bradyrhizobium sp. ORS 285]|nr:fragment of transposase (part 1) [Bradyrhizobium sp. ORS 285]
MRGKSEGQGGLLSYVSPEARIPKGHSLRKIQQWARDVLRD